MLTAIYSRHKHNEEGFTLIELLIVVIIIGILAAIALPIFIDQQKVAVDASVQSDVRNSVTNVTNAQAQQLGEAKAAISREGTELTLTTPASGSGVTAVAATSSTAKKSDAIAKFTNVPTFGSAYKLGGINAGGKKYVTAAFTFDSTTGQFTTAAAAATPAAAPNTSAVLSGANGSTVKVVGMSTYLMTAQASSGWKNPVYCFVGTNGGNGASSSDYKVHWSNGAVTTFLSGAVGSDQTGQDCAALGANAVDGGDFHPETWNGSNVKITSVSSTGTGNSVTVS